jgi:6-phosphofructokinase 1
VEIRLNILGHIQRGGNPSVFERLMAYGFINFALTSQKSGAVVYNSAKLKMISFEKPTNRYTLNKHKLNLVKNLMGLN